MVNAFTFISNLLLLVIRPFTVAAVFSNRHHAFLRGDVGQRQNVEHEDGMLSALDARVHDSWSETEPFSWRFAEGVAEKAAPSRAHALQRIKTDQRLHVEHDVVMLPASYARVRCSWSEP